jgi:CBS domain-containing protein
VKVRDFMSTPVITIGPHATSSEIADLLAQHRIGGVPVLDRDGRVIGIVSEFDLLSRTGANASEVMSTEVIMMSEKTDIAAVRSLLVDSHVRRLPVLADHQLVGIVAKADVIRLLVREWIRSVCGEAVRGTHPERWVRCGAAASGFSEQQTAPAF